MPDKKLTLLHLPINEVVGFDFVDRESLLRLIATQEQDGYIFLKPHINSTPEDRAWGARLIEYAKKLARISGLERRVVRQIGTCEVCLGTDKRRPGKHTCIAKCVVALRSRRKEAI